MKLMHAGGAMHVHAWRMHANASPNSAPLSLRGLGCSGLINNCLEKFVITSHGQDTWNQILAASGVTCHPWVSSCGYADHATYE